METPNLDHFDDILARLHTVFDRLKETKSPLVINQIEREGLIMMSELQATAPRLWNDFVSNAQKRRLQIATGQLEELVNEPEPVETPKPKTTKKKTKKGK